MSLQSVRLRRFKRIADAPMDLGPINVLVGGNNSGKSSIIQGLHFGVGVFQSVGLVNKWTSTTGSTLSTSLNPNQLMYSPSEDVYALGPGGKLMEAIENAITLDLVLKSGDSCSVSIRKGRNRNILVSIENASIAKGLSSLDKPFSIFSPGLAGIAKKESYVSEGVLIRALARGDANLVLRNILLRLWGTDSWADFLNDLREIFPNMDVQVRFEEKTDELIDVQVKTTDQWVPLELAGTGVLQATQILSYIHRFGPSIIVLDEPDSHLHPNNQRLLCALLRLVAEDRGTQVLLTTHSRHVVDAIGASSGFFWIRNGKVDMATVDDEIGVLMEIGALDVKERVGQAETKAVVLTEDELTRSLEIVLASSGFDLKSTVVLPYYGVTTISNLRPLVNIIRSKDPASKIVIHRDRDFLSEEELEDWKTKVRAIQVEPFVTRGRDIESYFIDARYLSAVNPECSEADFDALIGSVAQSMVDSITKDFVNGRIDILRKNSNRPAYDPGAIAVEANKVVSADLRRHCGKTVLRAVKSKFQSLYSSNLKTNEKTEHLADHDLAAIAKKVFRQ